MTYNHLTMKIEVVRQWHLYTDTLTEPIVVGKKDSVVSYVGHLRLIISTGNIWPLWSCWVVK